MDITEIIKKVKSLEGGAELGSELETAVGQLQAKNYEVLGEKHRATRERDSLKESLSAIVSTLGLEDGDLDEQLTQAQATVKTLKSELDSERAKRTEFEQKLSEAQGKVTAFERKTKIASIASAANAVPEVLERILGDRLDDLKTEQTAEGQTVVKLGDAELKEAIASDPALSPFAPALFKAADGGSGGANGNGGKPRQGGLPGGGGTPPKKPQTDRQAAVSSYIARSASGVRRFQSQKS